AIVIALALLGELFELWFGYGLARRYGGSKRAGWGALIGGLVGAIVGVPVPIIGSVIGGFVGAFAGATLLEYSRSPVAGAAVRAARPRGRHRREDDAGDRHRGGGGVRRPAALALSTAACPAFSAAAGARPTARRARSASQPRFAHPHSAAWRHQPGRRPRSRA